MKVINKSRFFFCAGFLVSTLCLSKVVDSVKLASSSIHGTKVYATTDGKSGEAEAVFKDERLQSALTQLRQNVNLSTTELLASSSGEY